jgi:radical SAM superfamily enzyme YgiQ (UPF0313 family)
MEAIMRLYLADLGHNQLTYSSDIYPIGIANLATYLTAYLRSPEPVDIRIFREPQDLKAALDARMPDVLGLSSYSWNHNLSRSFAQYAKRRAPNVLTLMGGPNFPLDVRVQESFMRGMPEIDIAVRGPTYEGERAFLNLMQRWVDAGYARDGLFEEPVAGNSWVHPRTGEFVRGAEVPRILDLDEIPSPYTSGWMDPFYATGYFPMLQIARGCPFTCQFCNSSVKGNSKVYAHSVKNVCDDLLFIAERVAPELPVCFADDNFGMYERDEEVADYIHYLQDRFGWPKYIRTTTGKNRADRIIKVMRKVRGTLPMTSAVQSLNPVVLENIKRSNIKLEAYAEIQKEVHAQGLQSYGELILCMPGETKESFMSAVSELLDTGVNRVSAHQLMLLHGAPLSDPDSRERHQFKTVFRVVARNLGNYGIEPVIETEEMVVETPDFSFASYIETRIFHLLLTIFYYEGNFEEAFEYARQKGVKPFDLIVRMQSLLDRAPAAFRTVIDDFVRESKEELFPTAEACVEWAKAHFDELVSGEVGGNLLSKYSMLGRFFVTAEALQFIRMGIEDALGKQEQEELDAVITYLESVLLAAPFTRSLEATPTWHTSFDVETLQGDHYARPLADYAFGTHQEFETRVPPDRKAQLLVRLKTFGEHPAGLGKFTRTMFARELRREVVRKERQANAAA